MQWEYMGAMMKMKTGIRIVAVREMMRV